MPSQPDNIVPFPRRTSGRRADPTLTYLMAFSTGAVWRIQCAFTTRGPDTVPLVHATARRVAVRPSGAVPVASQEPEELTLDAPTEEAVLQRCRDTITGLWGGEMTSVKEDRRAQGGGLRERYMPSG